MIKILSLKDADAIYEIINQAARAYDGLIPDDCYHEPYMSKEELYHEMESIIFFGWEEEGKLAGIMGFQPVKDVTLLRQMMNFSRLSWSVPLSVQVFTGIINSEGD